MPEGVITQTYDIIIRKTLITIGGKVEPQPFALHVPVAEANGRGNDLTGAIRTSATAAVTVEKIAAVIRGSVAE
mgnify:CR=1 FL=1